MTIISCFYLSACNNILHANSHSSSTEVVVAIPCEKINYLPYYIAVKKGYFEEKGITIKEKILNDTQEVYEEVSTDNADIGFGTLDSIVLGNKNQIVFSKLQESIDENSSLKQSYINEYTDFRTYIGVYSNKSYIYSNEATISKFSDALYKGQVFIYNSNTEDIVNLVSDLFSNMSKEELYKQIEFMKNNNFFPTNPITFRKDFESSLQHSNNNISKDRLFNKIIDNSYAYKSIDNLDL